MYIYIYVYIYIYIFSQKYRIRASILQPFLENSTNFVDFRQEIKFT